MALKKAKDGNKVHNPVKYNALRGKGLSKAAAARISNTKAAKKK